MHVMLSPYPFYFKKALFFSVFLHVSVFLLFLLIQYRASKNQPLVTQNIIQTKLVKLGPTKLDLLPRIPVSPPSTQAPSIPSPIVSTKQPIPTPSLINNKQRSSAFERLANIERIQKREESSERGDPRGSKKGTLSDWSMQTLGNQYATEIQERIQSNWHVPNVIPESLRSKLKSSIVFYIAPDGRVIKKHVESSSGNDLFDASLIRAIEKSDPLPKPPSELQQQIMQDGFEITFEGGK